MERLTNKNGMPFDCVKCAENTNCFSDMRCNKICLALEKLKAYEDLEEQGLLLRLPCKHWMGIVFGEQEVFWGIDMDYIENPIREIIVESSERFTWYDGWESVVMKGADENGLDWEFLPAEIGKTVFLTREEAEAALEKIRESEKAEYDR